MALTVCLLNAIKTEVICCHWESVEVGENSKQYAKTHLQKKQEYIGLYNTIEEAFQAYKQYKENIIKQVAEVEYNKGNITKECYEAMMNYQVEITD